jgi:hypothetical protein
LYIQIEIFVPLLPLLPYFFKEKYQSLHIQSKKRVEAKVEARWKQGGRNKMLPLLI